MYIHTVADFQIKTLANIVSLDDTHGYEYTEVKENIPISDHITTQSH